LASAPFFSTFAGHFFFPACAVAPLLGPDVFGRGFFVSAMGPSDFMCFIPLSINPPHWPSLPCVRGGARLCSLFNHSLSTCGLRNDCFERLELWLSTDNKSVTSLNLWGNYLRDAEVATVLYALQSNTAVQLNTLNLGSNRFGTPGIDALGTLMLFFFQTACVRFVKCGRSSPASSPPLILWQLCLPLTCRCTAVYADRGLGL
jgi:hypothetical protein